MLGELLSTGLAVGKKLLVASNSESDSSIRLRLLGIPSPLSPSIVMGRFLSGDRDHGMSEPRVGTAVGGKGPKASGSRGQQRSACDFVLVGKHVRSAYIVE